MKVIIYSTKMIEQEYLQKANTYGYNLLFVSQPLSAETAVLAKGREAAIVFTTDDADDKTLDLLKQNGIKYITTRTAIYDNVDIKKATELRIRVANIPAYTPHAIAEHTIALIMALNRKIVTADRQVHNYNFTIDNLLGFDLNNKTAGIISTGKTGALVAKILHGFGCRLIAYDPYPDIELTRNYHVNYVSLEQLCSTSDVITVLAPLQPGNNNLINKAVISEMKQGVMLINTAHGRAVNNADVYEGLQTGRIGYFGTDVYQQQNSGQNKPEAASPQQDALLAALLNMPAVLITPNQAFATSEGLASIAATSFYNLHCWQNNLPAPNEVTQKSRGYL
jgi:D-lactate dehydrogenase